MAWDHPLGWRGSRRSSTDDEDDTTTKLPEDLWAEILKRLPVQKLLQVRSVCKSWKALISYSSFIKIHQVFNNGSRRITFKPVAFPQTPRYSQPKSYPGVVHGVFMLYCYQEPEPRVALWNPTIRKHLFIPWPWRLPCRLEGFGLDPKTNDFKVVSSRMEGSYDVFSVREGAWRMNCQSDVLGSSPSPQLDCLTGCYLDGAIYWLTAPAPRGPSRLLRFDCTHDEFTAMDLPLELVSNQIAPHKLFLLGSRIVLIEIVPVPDKNPGMSRTVCQMWTMQEEKGGGSVTWTKAVAAGDCILFSHFFLIPLAMEPNRDRTFFSVIRFDSTAICDFEETLLLMDIGSRSQDLES